jgi:hypothetical protein
MAVNLPPGSDCAERTTDPAEFAKIAVIPADTAADADRLAALRRALSWLSV